MPRKKRPKILDIGRPQIPIDWNVVDGLLEAHVAGPGIADRLGCHPDTLYDRCIVEKGVNFTAYSVRKREGGKAKLAERQLKSAMQGNSTMLKILGEEWLGQGQKQQAAATFNLSDLILAINKGDVSQT